MYKEGSKDGRVHRRPCRLLPGRGLYQTLLLDDRDKFTRTASPESQHRVRQTFRTRNQWIINHARERIDRHGRK